MNQLEYNLLENYSSIIKQEFPNETKFSISFFADVEKYVDSIVPATIEGLNISNYIQENKITISTLFDYSSDVNNIDKLYSEINICTILDGFIEHKFIKIITSYLSAKESYDIILAPQNKLKTIIKLLKNRKELKINSSIYAPLIDLPVDEMEREIFDFLLNKEFDDFCSKYNIKKKRAFIFSGPPGTGKSLTLSVIKAKAKEKNVTVIKYDSAQSFIEEYKELYDSQENRIIILEEFDTYTQERVQEIGREEKDKVVNGNPVIKALLDLLDGIDQVSNCVFLFTTNHVETLDKAFVRPGRIDKVLVFNLPNKDQINRFLITYLPEYNSITDTMIEDYLDEKKISPSYAMLKSIIDTIRIKEFWNKQENKNVKIDDDEIKIMIDQIAQSGNKNEKINDPKKYIL